MRKKNLLFISLLFFLPCCSLIFGKSDSDTLYHVKRGDTFYEIGKRHGVSASELMRVNGIRDPRRLMAGSTIRIPTRKGAAIGSGSPTVARASYVGARAEKRIIATSQLGGAGHYVGRLTWPVKGYGVNSGFGRRRAFSVHKGVDIAAPKGTPVLAAHDGVVIYSGDGFSGYGNFIVLQGQGLTTLYAHNSRNRVRVGQRVRRGARVADVGATGRATGPHLHFETIIIDSRGRAVAVDPMLFYP